MFDKMFVGMFFLMLRPPPVHTRTDPLVPYPTLCRSTGTCAMAVRQRSPGMAGRKALAAASRSAVRRRGSRRGRGPCHGRGACHRIVGGGGNAAIAARTTRGGGPGAGRGPVVPGGGGCARGPGRHRAIGRASCRERVCQYV